MIARTHTNRRRVATGPIGILYLALAVATGTFFAGPTAAAAETASAGGDLMGLWQVETMLDQACQGIAQRYNLNPHQEKYTRALMTRRVKAFLGDHESELRNLLAEMFAARLTGRADAESARRWAQSARPIFEQARKVILDGNKNWRQILTDEQKKMHDRDLRDMEKTFTQLHKRFDRWALGDFDKFREGFARRGSKNARSSARDPRNGLAALSRAVVGRPYRANREDAWDAYVRRFIREHTLDDSQQQSALAILKECKGNATSYRQSHDEETTKIRLRMRELVAAGASADEKAKARDELRSLSRPIIDIYNQLRARLDAIPTKAQKAAREEQVQARLEQRMARLRERGQTVRKSSAATIRPVATPVPQTQPIATPTKSPAPSTGK